MSENSDYLITKINFSHRKLTKVIKNPKNQHLLIFSKQVGNMFQVTITLSELTRAYVYIRERK